MFKEYCVDALGIALLTWILHTKGVAVNRKARYIWHRNIAYLKGYHIMWKKISLFQKRMPHLLDFRGFLHNCRGIACWKKQCTFSQENCNLMKHASLQAGDASFLHVILHFRTGMHYLKLMLHIIETCLPLNGRLYFIRDALHLLEKKKNIIFCKG